MGIVNVVFLALHLVAVNVASAGPLVCVWLHRRGAGGDAAAWHVGRRLARVSLAALIFGVLLGLVQLGIAWTGTAQDYWDVIRRVPPRDLLFLLVEIVFSVVCLAVYESLWDVWRARRWRHALFAVLASTNLLYHFPPLMTVLGELAVRPELASEGTLTRDVVRGLILRPVVLTLVVHFLAASAAVTGVALMWLAREHEADGGEGQERAVSRIITVGAWIALVASLAQLGIGVWLLLELPAAARNGLIGNDWLGAGLFAASLVAAIGLLHSLAHAALGDTTRSTVRRSTVLMLTVVLLMTVTLVRSRQLSATRVAMRSIQSSHQKCATACSEPNWLTKISRRGHKSAMSLKGSKQCLNATSVLLASHVLRTFNGTQC